MDIYNDNSNTVIGLRLWEDVAGNYNHLFYITTKERKEKVDIDINEGEPFVLQTSHLNVPIHTAVKSHFKDLEGVKAIYKNQLEYFFSKHSTIKCLRDFIFDLLVPNFMLSNEYKTNGYDNNNYVKSLLKYKEVEDRWQ